MNISLSPFAPENLVSRDGFGSLVPRKPAHLHTQAEFGAYLRDFSRVPRRRPFIYLNRHTPSGQSRLYWVTQLRTDGVHCRESTRTGPVNSKVVPNGCCLGRSPCVCAFFPSILDIKFVGCNSRGHTGGRSHRISHPPSFCGACLYSSCEKDSAVTFPRRPRSRILCTNDLIVLHSLGVLILFHFFSEEKSQLPVFELTSQRVRRLRGYQPSYRGDRPWTN